MAKSIISWLSEEDIPRRAVAFTALLGVMIVAGATGSLADPRNKGYGDSYVVAESKFGHGRVIGPVRHTRVGRQVKTPGGSWLHCSRSCSETLRVNTVDFWENEEGTGPNSSIDNQTGILGNWLRWQRRY